MGGKCRFFGVRRRRWGAVGVTAVIAAFAVGMANGTFGTLAPVYGHDQGLDAKGIAYLFAVTAVLGALAQVPAGRISDRMDRRMVIVVLGALAAAVGFVTLLLNPQGGWPLFVLFGLYGFSAYPIYAIAVAHANDFAKKGEFGRVAGGMLLTMGTGLAIGPAVASLVMNLYQPVGLFIVTATFHGALAVTAFLRMKVRPVRVGGRIRFRAMNPERGISPGTVALDPMGYHLMLTGFSQPFVKGQCLEMTLHFAKAGDLKVELNIGGFAQSSPPSGSDAPAEPSHTMDMSSMAM